MHTHAAKTTETKPQAIANTLTERQGAGESALELPGKDDIGIVQQKIRDAISKSPRTQQLKAYQAMADSFTSQKNKSLPNRENKIKKGDADPIQRKNDQTGATNSIGHVVQLLSIVDYDTDPNVPEGFTTQILTITDLDNWVGTLTGVSVPAILTALPAPAARAVPEAIRACGTYSITTGDFTQNTNPQAFVDNIYQQIANEATANPIYHPGECRPAEDPNGITPLTDNAVETAVSAGLKAGNLPSSGTTTAHNQILHCHMSGGSHGLAFAYIDNADGSFTPYFLEIAMSRGASGSPQANMYHWPTGGLAYNSSHALPAAVPARTPIASWDIQ